MKTNKGFSLIEVLLAVVVIAILSATIIPRITNARLYDKFLAYTTAHQVAADVRLARRLAVTNGDDYKLEFSTGGSDKTYAIYKNNSGAWDRISEEKSIRNTIFLWGNSSVTFSPLGAADGNRSFWFIIGSYGYWIMYQVGVVRDTGRTYLESY